MRRHFRRVRLSHIAILMGLGALAATAAWAGPSASTKAAAAKTSAKWSGVAGEFYNYGIKRAADDIKWHMLYSAYFKPDDLSVAFGAQSGRPEYRHLLMIDSRASKSAHNLYQKAFAAGYAGEMKRHGRPGVLPQPIESPITELDLALITETQDKGTFPSILSPEDLIKVLNPYLMVKDRLDANKAKLYAYNDALAGKTIEQIPNPAHVVVLYEVSPSKQEKRWVAFVTGDTKQVADDEWQKIKP